MDEFEWPPNTLYVTEDDVLIVPGGDTQAWSIVERHLGCDVVVGTQATEPWVIRKAVTEDSEDEPGNEGCKDADCTRLAGHTGLHMNARDELFDRPVWDHLDIGH